MYRTWDEMIVLCSKTRTKSQEQTYFQNIEFYCEVFVDVQWLKKNWKNPVGKLKDSTLGSEKS